MREALEARFALAVFGFPAAEAGSAFTDAPMTFCLFAAGVPAGGMLAAKARQGA